MNLTDLKILILSLFLSIPFLVKAQDVTTVTATDDEISQNLDLEVVAAVFGESKDLEDFEKKLNDPEKQISNLDLNEDGEVDYLRVVDTSKKNTHVVTIQAVIGKDQYQDVAVIDVVKDEKGETQVQVVGDVYMYGSNYIVEPVYVHQPVIYVWFWGPYYHPWRSPFYWGYYPPYYRPWRPYPVPYYRNNVRVNINIHHKHKYRHTTVRRSKYAVKMQKQARRRDYAKQYPNKSFEKRHKDLSNASQLKQKPATSDVKSKPQNKPATKPSTKPEQGVSKDKRPSNSKEASKPSNDKFVKPTQPSLKDKQTGQVSTGQKVNKDWKTASDRSGNKSNVKNNKVSVPTQRPSNNKSNTRQSTPSNKSNYNKQNKTRENNSYNKSNFNKSNSNTKQNKTRPATTSPSNNMNKSYNRPQTRPSTVKPATTRPSNYNRSASPSPSRSVSPSRSRR
ncbi:hypothetical protein [Flammeovirga aprica]|uniref:DUF3300 domain-containing protein n=1 Tax=Flammeovirga aprica JL-4 TaxID=694437 RepID=A0A7X9RV02_9BACT|nr:hypothetical protein [Flammeovirga aprica]NME69202.1 hypothetical protein [Flammeovirga aprica JL-4]